MTESSGTATAGYREYVEAIGGQLAEEGLEPYDGGPIGYRTTTFHRRQWELTKFGLVDTFVVVGELDSPTQPSIESFADAAVQFALNNKSSLPRGFGGAVVVYPVVTATGVSAPLREWFQNHRPKHFGLFEIPVFVDLDDRYVLYNDVKPVWGGIYYNGFFDFIDESLTPG